MNEVVIRFYKVV